MPRPQCKCGRVMPIGIMFDPPHATEYTCMACKLEKVAPEEILQARVDLLATTLAKVLIKVGVLRSDVELTGPEIILAANSYLDATVCNSFGADPDLKPGPLTMEDRGWNPNTD